MTEFLMVIMLTTLQAIPFDFAGDTQVAQLYRINVIKAQLQMDSENECRTLAKTIIKEMDLPDNVNVKYSCDRVDAV